jgi:hypothetical protein
MNISILRNMLDFLTFRADGDEIAEWDHRHLVLGLVCTWIAGMGRNWDNLDAAFFQKAGVGSLAYVLLLSGFLWIIIRPLKPENGSDWKLLTMVCLTSPLAWLYAIPVERFTDLETAHNLNLGFLGVVAAWRVALLVFYLHQAAGFSPFAVAVATLFPLSLIVSGLGVLREAAHIMATMGGLRDKASADPVEQLVAQIVTVSNYAFLPLLICYAFLVVTSGDSN